MRVHPKRSGLIRLIVIGLPLLQGCTGEAPTPPDAAEARATLEQALEAWRNGEAIESQKDAEPSLVVSDSKWERGESLARFEIQEAPAPSGAQQKFRVDLWLVDAKGKERKEAVQYEVGTSPVRTVFRSMFQ